MSGSVAYVPPTGDELTALRDAAVASLLAYNTLAGANVEAERVDPVPTGALPRILVFADESGTCKDQAGGAPVFDMTGTISVLCLTQRAQRADAVADLDALVAQVKDCLLGDPKWTPLSSRIQSVQTVRKLNAQGDMVLGEAMVTIGCAWIAGYPPRLTTQLSAVNVTIGAPASVSAPASVTAVPVNVTLDL